MWPKRLRLRRLLLTVIAITCCTLLALSFRVQETLIFQHTDTRHQPPDLASFSSALKKPQQPPLPPQHKHPSLLASSRNSKKPWFMHGGEWRPLPGEMRSLWPHEDAGDRITQQLMFVPEDYEAVRNRSKLKKILLMYGMGGWGELPRGRRVFLRDRCPVDTCEIVTSQDDAPDADAILFKDRFTTPRHPRKPQQVYILYLLECPFHTQGFTGLENIFNWTATYRHDSDIVAPYEKFVAYDAWMTGQPQRPLVNYAANKTKKVAWFVSNCAARNRRLQYARELGNFIDVDIYGACGPKKCPRVRSKHCFEMLDRNYKFYLAFENSNCKDYITEKFYVNGLGHNVVPLVMGARPEDYTRSSPEKSFIHVEDFPSPKALADFLYMLDKNDTLYNSYLRWKGSGEFINTYFWCRLCAMLHAPPVPKVYKDIHEWWAGPGTCATQTWRNTPTSYQDKLGYVFT